MNSLINITNLNIKYNNKTTIKDLVFEVFADDTLVVIGQSGVGKSTILMAILDLIDYDGQIDVDLNKCSYMPQDLALFDFKSVYDNIIFPLKVKGKPVDEQKVNKLLEDLYIEELALEKVGNLSGGQKSRVALGRALIQESEILILDEPLANLDYLTRQSILEVLQNIKEKYKLTLIYVTHDIEECLLLANRILILKEECELLENHNLSKDLLISKVKNSKDN